MTAANCRFVLIALAAMAAGCDVPKEIALDVQAPPLVKRGEEFLITVTLENHEISAQKLACLEIGDEYLNGIAIVSTEPLYKDTMHVPADDARSFLFDLPVEPGRPLRVVFHAKAVKPGEHYSRISFCINSDASFLSRTLRTTVE